MRKSLLLMAVGTLVAATSSGSLFSVTEHTIAAPSNFSFTFAWGLNETHVAGYAHGQFTYNGSAYAANRAFRWSEASGFEVLGTLGGAFPWSHALAISAEGTVVGSSSALSLYNPSANRQTAYRTSATGAMTALPLPPSVAAGCEHSEARGISNSDVIVGWASKASGGICTSEPAIWAGGSVSYLPRVNGSAWFPWDVNDSQMVVGVGSVGGQQVPVVYSAGTSSALPLPSGFTYGEARSVNNAGQVVGLFCGVSGCRAFLWTAEHGTSLLPLPPGTSDVRAFSINDAGDVPVMGYSGIWKPFLLHEGAFYVLDEDHGVPLAVNQSGDVAGYDGFNRGKLWDVSFAPDEDADGVPDDADNCPSDENPDQSDVDFDGRGDRCDPFPHDPENDRDGDGYPREADNCPDVPNPTQSDRDNDGLGDACDPNNPPTANAGGPYSGLEGTSIAFSGSGIDPDAGTTLTYAWDFNGDNITDATTANAQHTYAEDGSYAARLTVSDGEASTSATVQVTVANVAPMLGAIVAPLDPKAVGTLITVGAPFTDPGALDTHSATIDWGDGAPPQVMAASGGAVELVKSYADAGVYRIRVTIVDDEGAPSNESLFEYVVVYDPSAGFVTGGGWIDSPPGAFAADPSSVGKASFGFVAKYLKGARVPTGNTEFQFSAESLNFRSTDYEWLVVSGPRGQFKGTGSLNGVAGYGFLLTTVDGQVKGGGGSDRFRIKIWSVATSTVVYDNQPGDADDASLTTVLGGGSVVIHAGK